MPETSQNLLNLLFVKEVDDLGIQNFQINAHVKETHLALEEVIFDLS